MKFSFHPFSRFPFFYVILSFHFKLFIHRRKSLLENKKNWEFFFLWSLRSYFVVKSLHFLKESKYFFLSSYTKKPRKSRKKIEKMYPWNWGVSIRYSAIEQFTDLSFEYVKSVCKIYVLLESKWRHYSVTMAFILNYLKFW